MTFTPDELERARRHLGAVSLRPDRPSVLVMAPALYRRMGLFAARAALRTLVGRKRARRAVWLSDRVLVHDGRITRSVPLRVLAPTHFP